VIYLALMKPNAVAASLTLEKPESVAAG